jgi:hypothetical protein
MTIANRTDSGVPTSGGPNIPVGVWIRIDLPEQLSTVGFTYVDPGAGFSVQGWQTDGATLNESLRVIVRQPMRGIQWHLLNSEEVRQLGLQTPPSWVQEFYGPQPKPGMIWGEWREHPKLQGRFHEQHPDDIQVVVHDGGPRVTRVAPETVWVRITGNEGDLFTGVVLNQPEEVRSVSAGSSIQFRVPASGEPLLMVTEKYLLERSDWTIHPCDRCGLSELFDAPSDLIRAVFSPGHERLAPQLFSAICGWCGGTQLVQRAGTEASEWPSAETPRRR